MLGSTRKKRAGQARRECPETGGEEEAVSADQEW
jgi:hypothetical protein